MKGFKVFLLCYTFLFSVNTLANEYKVPSINESTPLPLLSNERAITEKDKKALMHAKNWVMGKSYAQPGLGNAKVTFSYGAGQPAVICSVIDVCVIELQSGERVVPDGIHVGDKARWIISPTVGGKQTTSLVIKPTDIGLDTSLVIITDKRTYHIQLKSRSNDYMPIVNFSYPSDISEKWASYYEAEKIEKQQRTIPDTGEDISNLDFSYSISECECDWRPIRVYNNGATTVIQLDKQTRELPVLMVIDGEEQRVVNYRVHNQRYIVDSVFPEAMLVAGVGDHQQKVKIKRN